MRDLDWVTSRTTEVARDVSTATAEGVDREARWPEEAIRALQSVGLGGLVVPLDAGGLAHGMLALTLACEALARVCPSTALCFGMHCVGSAVIAARATPEQRQALLVPIAEGRHLTTLALSEPGTGAEFYFPQTVLEAFADGSFSVRGVKSFVTNGGMADSYVVSTVAADPHAPPGQFSCVVVPRDAPGLRWGTPWLGIGMRGNSARTVELDDVRLPPQALLGAEGDQLWYVFHVIAPCFMMAMCGTYLGIARAALDEAISHLSRRTYAHGGRAPGHSSVVQRDLGRLWSTVERTRALILDAAAQGDRGDPSALTSICAAKAEVGHCVVEATNQAMTLVGGIGYRAGGRLERMMRDARAAHVMSPTTSILEVWIGRAVLGIPLLAE